MSSSSSSETSRLVNLDLLRIICMFLVIVCHTSSRIGSCRGIQVGTILGDAALLCDPIFFSLSGFFAIRALKGSYINYLIRKITTITLPVMVYSIVIYACLYFTGSAELSFGAYFGWLLSMLSSPWWFIPALLPMLMSAPFLYFLFSKLEPEQERLLSKTVTCLVILGIIYTVLSSLANNFQHSTFAAAIASTQKLFPSSLMVGGYSLYFCLGYFLREDLIKDNRARRLIVPGIVGWAFGALLIQCGYSRSDPSHLWFFATIAFFLLFDKVQIIKQQCIKWISYIAQRCYSIYLVQSTVISFVVEKGFISDVFSNLAFISRFFLWFIVACLCWLISLLFAVLVDELFLKPIQKLISRVFASLVSI